MAGLSRRKIREEIFKLLFGLEFHSENELRHQIEMTVDEMDEASEEDRLYIREKTEAIAGLCDEIDEKINSSASGWKTSRMGKTELTIIRLAVYEIYYEDTISKAVSINEAVELAKKFAGDEAPGFVNGVLAKV